MEQESNRAASVQRRLNFAGKALVFGSVFAFGEVIAMAEFNKGDLIGGVAASALAAVSIKLFSERVDNRG